MADLSTLLGIIDLRTISMVSAAIGILIGVFNWIRKSGVAERQRQTEIETRQAQLFMQLFNRWNDPSFAKIYMDYRYKICAKADNDPDKISEVAISALFDSYDPDVLIPIQTLAQYFEGVSILVQKGLIDVNMVERLLSGRIVWYWDATETFIRYVRERIDDPMMYHEMEVLVEEMKRRKESTGVDNG